MALTQILSYALPACGAIAAAVTVRFALQIIHYHFFHPLAKFPGPFWGGVTRIWLALQFYYGTEVETEMKLHAKYGKCS